MHVEIYHKKPKMTGKSMDHFDMVALFFLDKKELNGKQAYEVAYEKMQSKNEYWINRIVDYRPTAVGDVISVDGKKVLIGQFSFEPALFK